MNISEYSQNIFMNISENSQDIFINIQAVNIYEYSLMNIIEHSSGDSIDEYF